MPDIGVADAVEKLVKSAPAPKAEEKLQPKAPAEEPPAEKSEKSAAPEEKEIAGADGLTAFEQELIEESKDEYAQLPEGARKPFLDALKRRYRRDARQMTELGSLRKAVTALKEAGVTDEDLVALVNKRRGKVADEKPATNGDIKRGFARYLTDATDPAERENLRTAEQVVRELVEDLVEERLGKRVKPLEDKLDASERQAFAKRAATLDQDIDDLEDKLGYPGSLVETYRVTLKREGLKYPDLSAEELLFRLADLKDLKAAMAKASPTDKGEKSKLPAAPVVKKPAKEELPRTKRGVVSITHALDLLLKPKR